MIDSFARDSPLIGEDDRGYNSCLSGPRYTGNAMSSILGVGLWDRHSRVTFEDPMMEIAAVWEPCWVEQRSSPGRTRNIALEE
jgi:hypothetical protein